MGQVNANPENLNVFRVASNRRKSENKKKMILGVSVKDKKDQNHKLGPPELFGILFALPNEKWKAEFPEILKEAFHLEKNLVQSLLLVHLISHGPTESFGSKLVPC